MECVGTDLRTARENRKITLGQVAEATRISHANLERLEEGKYKDLPGGVYNRAFIRAYCEFLGLEAKEMLARYEKEIAPQGDRAIRVKEKAENLAPAHIRPHPFAAWGAMLLLSVVGLYYSRHWIANVFSPYFSHSPAVKISTAPASSISETKPTATSQMGNSKQPASPGDQVPQQAVATPGVTLPSEAKPGTAVASRTYANAPAALPTQPARPPGKIRLEFEAVDKCWISVNADGNRALSRILEPGEKHVLDADDHFYLIVGNAGGLKLQINGKKSRMLGKAGEVSKVLINEQNIKTFLEKSLD